AARAAAASSVSTAASSLPAATPSWTWPITVTPTSVTTMPWPLRELCFSRCRWEAHLRTKESSGTSPAHTCMPRKRTAPSGVGSWTCFRTGWLISENLPPRPAQPTPRSWWHLTSSAEISTLITAPLMTSWSSNTPCSPTTGTPAAWGPVRRSRGPSVLCWTRTACTMRMCAPPTTCRRSWRVRRAAGSTWHFPPARARARRGGRSC
ncbi:SMPD3 isoform 11, partial [Pan troglodytes]